MNRNTIALLAMLLCFVGQPHSVQTYAVDGEEIAAETQQHRLASGTFTADLKMTLIDADGETRGYKLWMAVVREAKGDTRKLFWVNEPSHLRGTALLIWAPNGRESKHWLYLNARKRVKRIYTMMQPCGFLNSEWTYEDMEGYDRKKYVHRLIGEDAIDGRRCYLVEAMLKKKMFSGYLKQIHWVDEFTYDVLKTQCYDHQNALLKTIEQRGYETLTGEYRQAKQVIMTNHKSGRKLQMNFSHCRFDATTAGLDLDKKSFFKENSRWKIIKFRTGE